MTLGYFHQDQLNQKNLKKIVTFSCSNKIFVCYSPIFPYKIHQSIDDARKFLENEGKTNIEIVDYE